MVRACLPRSFGGSRSQTNVGRSRTGDFREIRFTAIIDRNSLNCDFALRSALHLLKLKNMNKKLTGRSEYR